MGIDDRDVVTGHEIKSIGHEETFSKDIIRIDLAKKELLSLANRVARRMRRHEIEGKTITLKVKYHDFKRVTRSVTRQTYTNDGTVIYANVCSLLEKTAVGKRSVRLLGISLSNLADIGSGRQLSLFNANDSNQKRRELNKTLDSVVDKFGGDVVRPGSLLDKEK
jgi:DNA polymerase-4